MGPEIALEKQMEILRLWAPGGLMSESGWSEAQLRLFREPLQRSHAIFVTQQICELLYASMDSLPDMAPADLPRPPSPAFVWLESPLVTTVGDENIISHYFAWFDDSNNGNWAVGYHALFNDGRNIGFSMVDWPYEDTWSVWNTEDTSVQGVGYLPYARELILAEGMRVRKFLIALIAFMGQRICSAAETPVSRPTRRRWEKAVRTEPPILRVISLRAREQKADSPKSSHSVDWNCQWIVRGHWVNQWFPKENRNKPLFRAAYVKGPPGKPLKSPQHPIFVVNR